MKPDITLIFPDSPFLLDAGVFPPLGIMYLAAYLKMEGFSSQCLDFGIGHSKEMAKSDIIGISFTTPQRKEAYELVQYYKEQGKFVMAGGPHPTHMADECLRHGFDMVVTGYGETGLSEILRKKLRKNNGVLWNNVINGNKTMPFFKLDQCPYPDRDALPVKEYKYKIDGEPATVLMTSRGCPYQCSFCAKLSRKCYLQSAGRTINEINHINERYGFNAFMIFDDVFILSKSRLRLISEAMKDRGFKFRCFARSNLITDEVCIELQKMGVVEIGIGVESGSDKILNGNMKGTTRNMNTRAVQRLRAYGIRAKAFLIIGLPGETTQTINDTCIWIDEAKPDDVDVSIFQPMPGSKIFKNKNAYEVDFKYDGFSGWYKGTPGEYSTTVSTPGLTGEQIVAYRDRLETVYKNPNFLR